MNSTDRVMAAVEFRRPDRVPTWESYWGRFPELWQQHMGLGADTAPADYYGIDMTTCVADECFFPSTRKLLTEDGAYEIWQDGWGRTVRTGKADVYFMETLDSVLKTPSDLDELRFEPATLPTRYDSLAAQVANAGRAGRCVFAKVGGLYIRSHFLRGEDKLLVDMALDEGFCDALFDKVLDHMMGMALNTLQALDCWDTGLWVYDDMANSSSTMFSPAMFERYLLPRYRKLISICREAGCRHVFLHSDGNILPFMDMLLDAGFEGFNPLEPRCGLELTKLRDRYGAGVVFFGGVCNTRILPSGDKAAIEAHVRPLIEMGREGGLILGQASIGDDVPPEAYDYYRSLIDRYGAYSQ